MCNLLKNKWFSEKYLSEYCSGVFSDELDKMGYRNQVINSWVSNRRNFRFFGEVRTLELEEIETDDERIDVGLGFLASLGKGEVLVVNGSMNFAYFGELMTRLSSEIGIEGAVINGLTRDSFYTLESDFSILAKGYSPKDIKGRGRVKTTDVTFLIDGVSVNSRDYIFADADAAVIIPRDIADELFVNIEKAVAEELEIKRKIASGVTVKEILLNHKSF